MASVDENLKRELKKDGRLVWCTYWKWKEEGWGGTQDGLV